MHIGIFTKFNLCGGSERRAAEMANAIAKYTDAQSFILSEGDVKKDIEKIINPNVTIVKNVFLPEPKNAGILYDMDVILVINTDCRDFTHSNYWLGRSKRHNCPIDLKKIKQFVFLFNFLVSPARHLYTLKPYCDNIKIITTNKRFFEEISAQDRYELIWHIPRIILESPINPELFQLGKTNSEILRVGQHSKSPGSKWNDEYPDLIKKCNEWFGKHVSFDFMGMNSKVAETVKDFSNVTIRKENNIPVPQFLQKIDIFTFFPSWKREEPWCRVIGEALMGGCPVLATNKGGNIDQIVPKNNGYLCESIDDYFKHIVYLFNHRDKRQEMSDNAKLFAKHFSSENVIKRFMEFICE
tara:strand:+ start:1306 stop:2370 length:1065 start_codon:yes stop_codon:yes gene_type:complete